MRSPLGSIVSKSTEIIQKPLHRNHRRSGYLLYKLDFGGESPLTMRARCSVFRYFPNPLGIVTAKQLVKLVFVELILTMKENHHKK